MYRRILKNKITSFFKESYGIESSKSGFSKEETNPVTSTDKAKVDEVMNNKNLPEVAEDGKAYVVKWADGRGRFACKKKSYLPKWLEKTGDWAEIISIKYEDPKDLKIINELKGGLADDMSIKDIAKKHKVSPSTIRGQVDQGIDVEQEHTNDSDIAKDIAKDHEVENPKYYDDLKKAGIEK